VRASRAFAIAYAALTAADLAAIATGHVSWRLLTKPPLMLLLAGAVIASRPRLDLGRQLLVVALAFSAIGDWLLLGPSDSAFVAGTLAFAASHVAYIACFVAIGGPTGLVRRRPWLVVPYLLAWGGATAVLWPHLAALRPVAVPYSFLLTAMAVVALDLVGHTRRRAAIAVAIGAAIYMSSDTNIALARFDPALAPPHADFLIMLTYLAAQTLMAAGIVGARGDSERTRLASGQRSEGGRRSSASSEQPRNGASSSRPSRTNPPSRQ